MLLLPSEVETKVFFYRENFFRLQCKECSTLRVLFLMQLQEKWSALWFTTLNKNAMRDESSIRLATQGVLVSSNFIVTCKNQN